MRRHQPVSCHTGIAHLLNERNLDFVFRPRLDYAVTVGSIWCHGRLDSVVESPDRHREGGYLLYSYYSILYTRTMSIKTTIIANSLVRTPESLYI